MNKKMAYAFIAVGLTLFFLCSHAPTVSYGAESGQLVPAISNKYQGKPVMVNRPNTVHATEQDMTRSRMEELFGSNYSSHVSSSNQSGIVNYLESYWLPNSHRQIMNTFQAFQGTGRTIKVKFDRNITDTFGYDSWARCHYIGYGKQGNDNHMVDVTIVIDLEDCQKSEADGLVSGRADTHYVFDQIVAHEMMHAYLAESAPGYVLGVTHREWFSEGVAEMANGGVAHMNHRGAMTLCGQLGIGGVDYGGSYLAVAYAAWLSANNGYGESCSVSASNLAYGLDRILAKLRETGDLNQALNHAVGMSTQQFEEHVRLNCESGAPVQIFQDALIKASTNSEGTLGSGSLIGGNLKIQKEYVVSNHRQSLSADNSYQYVILA